MDTETLFTEQKWNILKLLTKDKFSPLQLAQKSNTTIANISQQLRLLEMGNLVQKEKIPNREKGKPRALFSLTGDYAYLILVMKGFGQKRLLKLGDHHKLMIKIWFLDDSSIHYYLEKFYWKIEEYIGQITAIVVNPVGQDIEVIIVSEKPRDIERKIGATTIKKPNDKTRSIIVKAFNLDEFKKLVKQGKEPFSSLSINQVIYDPEGIISDITNKGGGNKE